MGHSYTDRVIKFLFATARTCAYPDCATPLVFIDAAHDVREIAVEIAHIRSAKPGGPRYDSDFPGDQLDSDENLLLLCGVHHHVVDQNGSKYSTEELLGWKKAQAAEGGGFAIEDNEILAARVRAAERSLMDLALRVNRDLRPFTLPDTRILARLAARLGPGEADAFAARPEAMDLTECFGEVVSRVEGLMPEDFLALRPHPGEMALPWRPGIDEEVMDRVALAIHYATEALYQGKLGQWPAMCVPVSGGPKVAWSMGQLIDVVEPKLLDLEQKVAEQETTADQTPRLPWFDLIPPGTLPLPTRVWGPDPQG